MRNQQTVVAGFFPPRAAGGAATRWMLAPGPIFAGPYWGQVDAVGTVPLLFALIAAGRGRWATAGVLAGLAAMVKPQFGIGLIVIVAAALYTWIREGDWRPLVRSVVASGVTALVLGLPFRAGPKELVDLVERYADARLGAIETRTRELAAKVGAATRTTARIGRTVQLTSLVREPACARFTGQSRHVRSAAMTPCPASDRYGSTKFCNRIPSPLI